MTEVIVDGEGEDIRGHRELDGINPELPYNIEGNSLMLRVNKGPVLMTTYSLPQCYLRNWLFSKLRKCSHFRFVSIIMICFCFTKHSFVIWL